MGNLLGIPQQGQPGELTVSQSGPSRYDRDCLFQLVAGVCELGHRDMATPRVLAMHGRDGNHFCTQKTSCSGLASGSMSHSSLELREKGPE